MLGIGEGGCSFRPNVIKSLIDRMTFAEWLKEVRDLTMQVSGGRISWAEGMIRAKVLRRRMPSVCATAMKPVCHRRM